MGTESQKLNASGIYASTAISQRFFVPEEENLYSIVQLCQSIFTQEGGPPWISKRESSGVVRIRFAEARSS
jgi:hypothetical protein